MLTFPVNEKSPKNRIRVRACENGNAPVVGRLGKMEVIVSDPDGGAKAQAGSDLRPGAIRERQVGEKKGFFEEFRGLIF